MPFPPHHKYQQAEPAPAEPTPEEEWRPGLAEPEPTSEPVRERAAKEATQTRAELPEAEPTPEPDPEPEPEPAEQIEQATQPRRKHRRG